MAAKIDIMNEALAELPTAAIIAGDETSAEAQAAIRHYQSSLDLLLGSHDWGFATRRALLAEVANTRTNEWLYAYAAPVDMARPRSIIPDLEGLGYLPVEGPWTPPYYEVWAGMATGAPHFIIENGVIYSNVETATLEYGIEDVDVSVMPALFRRALALELASRLAMPLKKDRQLKGDLIKQAEAAKDRAMADDENRHPRTYPVMSYSEAAAARRSW